VFLALLLKKSPGKLYRDHARSRGRGVVEKETSFWKPKMRVILAHGLASCDISGGASARDQCEHT
jgi:hypothetical protein